MIKPEKILITGGSGFFGKSMLDFLQKINCTAQITVLAPHREKLDQLPGIAPDLNLKLFAGDIGNKEWFDDYQLIIHAATLPAAHPDIIHHTLNGCANVAECARYSGAKLLFLSSGAVYQAASSPLREDSPTIPATAYGKAKLAAENLLREQCRNIAIARCFSFIGPYIDINMHYAVTEFIRDAMHHRPITIKGDGLTVRSYLSAGEWAEWCWQLALHGNGIYNVGSDIPVTIMELARIVQKAAGSSADIVVLNEQQQNARIHYLPSIDAFKRDFGMTPETELSEMVISLLNLQINQQ